MSAPGRNDPCWCGSGKKYKRCHLDADSFERSDLYRTALHEAGHVIIAHALGREVELVRVGTVELPPGHPENPHDFAIVSSGFHRARPLLADEVKERHAAGLPLTNEQLDWLRTSAVIDWGGVIAESSVVDQDSAQFHAESDFQMFAQAAGMLGQTEERDGRVIVSPEFQTAAARAAQEIIADLSANVVQLADLLAAHPDAEWPEETIQHVLGKLGSPRGSHCHMLETLTFAPRVRHEPGAPITANPHQH